MKTVIRLEVFNKNGDRLWGHKPWVSRLTPRGCQYVKPLRDYSLAKPNGSRGVFQYYHLDNGVYEVSERTDWQRTMHYYILAADGDYREISREEVREWLKNASSE